MRGNEMEGILAFIKQAENLKNTLRCAYTSDGKQESAAEHSWRLALLALVCAGSLPGLNLEKALKLAVIHDLAEAICGDTPAIYRENPETKAARERQAVQHITRPLPARLKEEISGLWEEYNAGASDEARYVKALDKLETLIQHNQGRNPQDFNYTFNITYGLDATNALAEIAELRGMVDAETIEHTRGQSQK